VDEGRKRVLAIVAGILVARHLKNPEDLHDSRPKPQDRVPRRQCCPMGGANHEENRRDLSARKFDFAGSDTN